MVNRSEPKSIQEIDIRRNLLSGKLSLSQELDFLMEALINLTSDKKLPSKSLILLTMSDRELD